MSKTLTVVSCGHRDTGPAVSFQAHLVSTPPLDIAGFLPRLFFYSSLRTFAYVDTFIHPPPFLSNPHSLALSLNVMSDAHLPIPQNKVNHHHILPSHCALPLRMTEHIGIDMFTVHLPHQLGSTRNHCVVHHFNPKAVCSA